MTVVNGAEINSASLTVTVDLKAGDEKNLTYTFTRVESDWSKSVLDFTGTDPNQGYITVDITIQDYKYCTPTTVTLTFDTKDNNLDCNFGR